MHPVTRLVVALGLALGACGKPVIDKPMEDFLPNPDAQPPPAPLVQSYPSLTPYALATIRGTATDARRIVIETTTTTTAELVLPDGTFCVDVPLHGDGAQEVRIWGQGVDGAVSATAAEIVVDHDVTASAEALPSLCNGADARDCSDPKAEICDNGLDDDCNGLGDGADPACSGCGDDVLEPNDEPGAPRIEPGAYPGLSVCPDNPDFYAVALDAYDDLRVSLAFSHVQGDVDLRLYDVDRETVLESSVSVSDDEEIMYHATAAGVYLIKVYGFNHAENQYDMEIAVD